MKVLWVVRKFSHDDEFIFIMIICFRLKSENILKVIIIYVRSCGGINFYDDVNFKGNVFSLRIESSGVKILQLIMRAV